MRLVGKANFDQRCIFSEASWYFIDLSSPKRVHFLASTTVWISVCAVLVVLTYLNEEQLLIDCVLQGGKVERNNGRVQGAMTCRTS